MSVIGGPARSRPVVPASATRAAIFAYAARMAQQRVHGQQAASATAPLARPLRVIWRRAFAFGGLAVAALAGLTVVSRWPLLPTAPTSRQAAGAPSQAVVSAQRTAPGLQPQSPAAAAPPVHKEEDPASQARREPYPAPARPYRPPGEGPSVARARGEALAHTEVQASAQSAVTVAPAAASRVQSAQSGEQLRRQPHAATLAHCGGCSRRARRSTDAIRRDEPL